MRNTLIIATLLMLSACATQGNNFKMADVNAMRPGVTTVTDATTELGKPKAYSDFGNGSTLIQWMYLSPFGGKHVAILFKDNKMVRVTFKSE